MSTPRTKRQYGGGGSDAAQRQITSFFAKSGVSSSTPPISAPTVVPPPPPAQIQANLISVGMRVRKSVPEGYKTGQLYSGFSLWSEGAPTKQEQAVPRPIFQARGGELAPFCGLNKVGGLAAQDVPGLDDLPRLTGSQDSIGSVDFEPVHVNHRKRVYSVNETAEEVDVPSPFENGWRDSTGWVDGECSPRSLAPVGWESARVMAVPKGRRKGAREQEIVVVAGGGAGGGVDDFEEAEFLAMEVEY